MNWQLGWVPDSVLKYRFPELRAALLKRLPERKRFIDEQLLDVIQRASIEEPRLR